MTMKHLAKNQMANLMKITVNGCYSDGKFTYESKEQLIDFCVEHMANENWPAEKSQGTYGVFSSYAKALESKKNEKFLFVELSVCFYLLQINTFQTVCFSRPFDFSRRCPNMATTRLMPLHTGKGRAVGQAISAIIDYTENPQKTDGGRLITSWQCDSRMPTPSFFFTKNQYIQKTGRVRGEDNVIAYHLRQSFVPGEITPEDANRLGCELAKRFTKGNHAYIVCTHIDKAHIHNHVIWNSTALSQTRKFRKLLGQQPRRAAA